MGVCHTHKFNPCLLKMHLLNLGPQKFPPGTLPDSFEERCYPLSYQAPYYWYLLLHYQIYNKQGEIKIFKIAEV